MTSSMTEITNAKPNDGARPSISQRNDVQGLRGLAIAAVLLFHFYPDHFPNGYLGVDIFFVISGFLIVRIFGRAVKKSGGFLTAAVVGDFYFRRFRRILPVHLLYCAVAIAIFSWQVDPLFLGANKYFVDILCKSKKSALAALVFCTNLRALFHRHDYFVRLLSGDLFSHVWSLSVEIQFYLLVPLFFGINAVLNNSTKPRIFFTIVSALSISLYVSSSSVVSFQLVLCRLWQFFAVPCIEQSKTEDQYSALPSDEGEVGEAKEPRDGMVQVVVLLLSSSLLLMAFIPFVTVDSLVARIGVTVSAAVLIAYGKEPVMYFQKSILSLEVLVWLGDVSYSLYLLHSPLATYVVHKTESSSWSRFSLVPTALVIAAFLHRFYEQRYHIWSKRRTAQSCGGLLLLSLGLPFSSSYINDFSNGISDPMLSVAINVNNDAFGGVVNDLQLKECAYKKWRNWPLKQLFEAGIGEPLGYCEMPKGEGRLRFLVIGNSYATNQADLVHRHFKPFFSSFTVYGQASCEVLAVFSPDGVCGKIVNYTDVFDIVKADVIFLIQRYMKAKEPLVALGSPDPITEEMLYNLLEIENREETYMASLLFLIDSIPVVDFYQMIMMNQYFRQNMSSYEINTRMINHNEDFTARPRTQILAKKCKKCILYDVEPPLRCGNLSMCAFDEKTHLSYFEHFAHLTQFGKKTIEPVYAALAKRYWKRLTNLTPKYN